MKTHIAKAYSRRDSAVAVLRKMGVPASKYNDFIEKTSDGFICHITMAEDYIKSKPIIKEKKTSLASRIKDLIREGHDNKKIWEIVKKEFGFPDDSRKHYPSWYRSRMKNEEFYFYVAD